MLPNSQQGNGSGLKNHLVLQQMITLEGGLTITNVATKGRVKSEAGRDNKERYSVSLSAKSKKLLDDLKEFTDAETTTEVFRDSLRLSYLIMTAQKRGLRVELRDPADPNARPEIFGIGNSIPG